MNPFAYRLGACACLSASEKIRLVNCLGREERVFDAPFHEIALILGTEKAEAFCAEKGKGSGERAEEEALSALEKGIRFLTVFDPAFPENLKNIASPPYGIFVRGKLMPELTHIAVVGARRASPYGLSFAEVLGRGIADAGAALVSGMARGIDSAAQKSALERGGYTAAVLGCGPDICYPSEKRGLYQQICECGAVISEYVPGTMPRPAFFPARNRIISGLSKAVAVVEAAKRSGSLITADMALDQGRDVFALPGRVGDRLSEGCNLLIRQGAGILLSVPDFLSEAGVTGPDMSANAGFIAPDPSLLHGAKMGLAKEEEMLYSFLCLHPKSIAELENETSLSAAQLLMNLSAMELKGAVRQVFPGEYVRRDIGES